MLQHVYIKNIALIEKQEIYLYEDLNILSGETGAGKSILIDAINFCLGERFSKELIRTGQDEAIVELMFHGVNEEVNKILDEFGIEREEHLLISRSIHRGGKNLCRVNGRTVTLGMLKDLGKNLIDVHGQHEHQSLLNSSKHIDLLDRFGGQEILSLKEKVSDLYKHRKEILKKIEALGGSEIEKARKMDLLQFQITEIKEADLKNGEEEKLTERLKILSNVEKLSLKGKNLYEILHLGGVHGQSVSEGVDEALRYLQEISSIDVSLENAYKSLESISYQIQDIIYEIREYNENIEYNPNELYEVEKRLDLIYNLKRKYGSDIEEILKYYEEIQRELEVLDKSEAEREKLDKELKVVEERLNEEVLVLSKNRKILAQTVEDKIVEVLQDLEMKNTIFEITITSRDEYTGLGIDEVEFMISTNLGEPVKPLAKIASGGEMSRIMLAIKTVLAGIDQIGTLIFDEIDTGISGKVAQKVAEKLAFIAKKYQVICITHLPQIASMGEKHFFIEKTSTEEQTITNVHVLSREERIREIARMIGGVSITETTLKSAEEMISLAQNKKMAL